jgi:hypothetical protein
MAFTDAQVRQLKAKLDPKYIKTRTAEGVNLNYVEGWHVRLGPNNHVNRLRVERRMRASLRGSLQR